MMMGCQFLEGYVPDFDATVVTRVLDAGGVILGKANCEELCNSMHSMTSASGPVLHPSVTGHSPGGSSSGCAVLLATKEVDIAIGGDQGGSVRSPASWCGLVGLKPTFGLVPYTGGASREFVVDYLCPMARTVDDCALMLEVIAGYDDGKDARQPRDLVVPNYTEQLKDVDTSGLRIALLEEGFGHKNSNPEVDKLIRHRIGLFAAVFGSKVDDVSIPLHSAGQTIGKVIGNIGGIDAIFSTGGVGLHHTGVYPTSMMRGVASGLALYAREMHPYNKMQILTGSYLKENNYLHLYGKAQNLRRQLTRDYDKVLEDYDVIVMPTVPVTAPPLLKSDASFRELMEYCADVEVNLKPGNLTGHPSISINAGNLGGSPVGLLLTGKKFGELRLLQIARAFENFVEVNANHIEHIK
ncbi:amidase-like [Diadema antillarum]|uniref:amidase-like n=1 Tax=Diadema antillarum TaxID=105358 RepID=UPI003A87E25A